MKITTQRAKDMSLIEREIIKMIFNDAIKFPHDGKWRTYKRDFTFQGTVYTVTCSFSYDAINFLYRNMEVIGETKTIIIDPMDYRH
jgi:hypothetical protein